MPNIYSIREKGMSAEIQEHLPGEVVFQRILEEVEFYITVVILPTDSIRKRRSL